MRVLMCPAWVRCFGTACTPAPSALPCGTAGLHASLDACTKGRANPAVAGVNGRERAFQGVQPCTPHGLSGVGREVGAGLCHHPAVP